MTAEQYKVKLDEQIEKDCTSFSQKYGDRIYHYTSVSALDGMVRDREFWFPCASSMNDKLDSKYLIDSIQYALLADLGDNYKQKIVDLFDNSIYPELNRKYPYNMSFSTVREDAAQWERYADNAAGVCIGFNSAAMKRLFRLELFQEVFYNYPGKEHQHFANLKEYLTRGTTGSFIDTSGNPSLRGLISNLIITANLYKHFSFSAEKEVRLCPYWHYHSDNATIVFKQIRGIIRKVCIINIPRDSSSDHNAFEDLFDEIIIGPRSQQNITELQDYFISLGYPKLSSIVKRSVCPLR
ncbi:MAG: DUF2971 domain-containing protein [Oscillospiraceae bacterium]|nr:DUF2971 domain-containing protein [Oscillospiraceae bacterium]